MPMSTSTLSPSARAELLLGQLDDIVERGTFAPVITLGSVYSSGSLRRLLQNAPPPAVFDDVERQLNEMEERALADERQRASAAAEEQEREAAANRPDPVYEQAQERMAEYARQIAFRKTDAGRLERLIELQERTVELLEALQKRG